ncbi:extracellular solute-binding protein [Paenibacillus silvae]|uniref:ABC transporter substrate-binding protein n=2 Tax=Paenibacillus silvae TaxID=1325358 RepID=A0ABQ1ZD15_9BACL|nr:MULTISPECIES: extracellular solute-binding protein [Paenibacillus]MCK6074107.1 extracellular solute-binding protein [Paenibacillus silvae]MCK6148415.1 extracellular solute-binding protein [Paenibacillus silvae]MCK6266715.1 extracellular solute-binding protein [Paenibacillus silvae]GGH59216.1 ABC transporter substrate-binding protein [Paenibacillus silvae]
MKKMWVLMLVTVLLLSACSSGGGGKEAASGGGSEKTNEITIWAWDKAFNVAALEQAKAIYQKENPDLKINIIENAQDAIIQKLNTGLNSGTSSGLPNVVLIEDYRAQSFLSAYPDAFKDLSSTIKASDFADYKIGPTSYEGKQYGIPFDSGVAGLYYRTDLLEQAGYKAADLQDITWDDYIKIGEAVKAKTGKELLSLDPNDLGIIRMMIQTAGKWYTAEDGKTPDLNNNPALKEAFETYKKMMDANIVKLHSDWSQFVANANNGDVATIPTGNWFSPSVRQEASQAGKWAVAPMPKMAGQANSVHASNLGGSSWYIMNNVPGADQAADFMAKTFGSDKQLYQDLLTKIGAIGTYTPAVDGEAYNKPDEFFSGQKIFADFANWTKEIPKVNYGSNTYAIEDILVVEMQAYLNGKSLDDVLNDAQKQAEAQLN